MSLKLLLPEAGVKDLTTTWPDDVRIYDGVPTELNSVVRTEDLYDWIDTGCVPAAEVAVVKSPSPSINPLSFSANGRTLPGRLRYPAQQRLHNPPRPHGTHHPPGTPSRQTHPAGNGLQHLCPRVRDPGWRTGPAAPLGPANDPRHPSRREAMEPLEAALPGPNARLLRLVADLAGEAARPVRMSPSA